MTTHTLSVLVENKPGVLAHVAGAVLAAGIQYQLTGRRPDARRPGQPDDDRGGRRVHAGRPGHEQLDKLVRVLKVVELPEAPRSSASSR